MLSFDPTELDGLFIANRSPLCNDLGDLTRFYCQKELKSIGINDSIAQINQTLTYKTGSIRGMHFQFPPYAEDKMVSCIRGEIFDVAVDIRKNSSTFLHYHAEILSKENNKSMCIPKGFAHGFQSMSNDCEVLYLHTEFYSSKLEKGLRWNDPLIGIEWPLTATNISTRDVGHELLDKNFKGVYL